MYIHTQAVIGIAFSCGFLLGPVIGAAFSVWGKTVAESGGDPFTVFQYPALFALTLALLDIALLVFAFPETLPVEKRALSLGQGVLSTLYLINPLSLFRFDALSKMPGKGVCSNIHAPFYTLRKFNRNTQLIRTPGLIVSDPTNQRLIVSYSTNQGLICWPNNLHFVHIQHCILF